MSTVTINNKTLQCVACKSVDMGTMKLLAGADIECAYCNDCGVSYKIAAIDDAVSIVVTGKINPARSMYEIVNRGGGRAPKNAPGVLNHSFPSTTWTLEDPADHNDRLIKIDDKGFERGGSYPSEGDAKGALNAFKKRVLFQGNMIVPSDVWFLSTSTVERSDELRGSSPLELRVKAIEISKREMGWKDFKFDPTVVPIDDEIERELENLHRYLPASVLRTALAFAASCEDRNAKYAKSLKSAVIREVSGYICAPLQRVKPARKRRQFYLLALTTMDISQRVANLQTLTAMSGMLRTSGYFENIRTAIESFRTQLRTAIMVPKFFDIRVEAQQKLADIADVVDTFDVSILDELRRTTKSAFPSQLPNKPLRFAHLVTAIDMGDSYDKEPSDDGEKLMNLALEIGMDTKYDSKEDLLHDLTYLARGLGHTVDLSEEKEVKGFSKMVESVCKTSDSQIFGAIDESFGDCLSSLAWLTNSSLVFADQAPDPRKEKKEIDTIVKNLSVKTRKDSLDLFIKWGREELLFLDTNTRSTMCRALIRIVLEFGVKPFELWQQMIDNPTLFDELRDDQLLSDPLGHEEESGPVLDLAEEFRKSLDLDV